MADEPIPAMDLTNPGIQEMLGGDVVAALVAARQRLVDDTVMVRCEAGLWLVERAGQPVVVGLTHEGVVAAVEALA